MKRIHIRHAALLILVALLSLPLAAVAQSLTGKIEDVGGFYRLTYTVTSSDAEGFTPPSLAAFEVLSGPSTSTFSSYQMVNGHTSHSATTSYTYILSAKKGGRITLGPASVRVGGRTLHSRPLTINAQAGQHGGAAQPQRGGARGGGSQSQGDDVQQAGSAVTQRDLFIDVTPSRTRVKEQEAILLTYRIHARVGVGLSNTQLTQKPDFKGLISQEIPLPGNQIQTTLEHRGGTTYRTGTILQYVIFPQQSGRLDIPSITFDCTVIQQDHTMDFADAFFNGGGSIGVQVRRTVPVTSIMVEPLPQPKPANFSGAVGRFTIDGKVLNPQVNTNDVATYRITLNGLGNLKLITPPKVTFPQDFDSYDPKTNDNTRVTANGLTGQLTFDYTFVPRNVGKYTIPAIEFVYFDTESGAYKTIRTAPVTLNVLKGERSNADVDKQLALLRSDIRDIHPTTAPATAWSLGWNTLAYWLIFALICVVMGAALFAGQRFAESRGNVAHRRSSRAGKQARQRLQEAERLLTSDKASDFYAAVSKALTGFVADLCNVPQASLGRDEVERLLTEKGVAADEVKAFTAALDTCEYAQFAPGADTQRQALYDEALRLITSIKR